MLNYDFYTFSPKHFKKLNKILHDYPSRKTEDLIPDILYALSEMGKVSLKCVKFKGKDGEVYIGKFIKFWPHPKHIDYFRKFDKRKMI